MDEFGRNQRFFQRPDALRKPAHQRQIVADTAQQSHRGVRMAVDQPGYHRVMGQVCLADRVVPRSRVRAWQDLDNATAGNGDCVVSQDHSARDDGHDPAAVEQGIDVGHRKPRGAA